MSYCKNRVTLIFQNTNKHHIDGLSEAINPFAQLDNKSYYSIERITDVSHKNLISKVFHLF